jgi:hypothetical protein
LNNNGPAHRHLGAQQLLHRDDLVISVEHELANFSLKKPSIDAAVCADASTSIPRDIFKLSFRATLGSRSVTVRRQRGHISRDFVPTTNEKNL